MIIIAPGQQERLPQALGGLEEERTYLLKQTRALLEKLEERYLGGACSSPDVPQFRGDPMAPFDPDLAFASPFADRGDEVAASGWDIARKDVRNVGRDGRVPYQKRAHQDTTMLS